MTQYIVETEEEQPQLFIFTQQFTNDKEITFADIFQKFEKDFQDKQIDFWNNYWSQEGENLILNGWKLKYSDFLAEETTNLEKDSEQKSEPKKTQKEVILESHTDSGVYQETDDSWQPLWQQHTHEVYCAQHNLFQTIYYNYYLDFKNCLPDVYMTSSSSEDETTYTAEVVTADFEQLHLLGLPTAFGSKSRFSKNHKKTLHNTNHNNTHFSSYFSDDVDDLFTSLDQNRDALTMDSADTELFDDAPQLHALLSPTISKSKRKKRNRKLRKIPAFILEDKTMLKYWRKRFSLFSRFDEGIRLDRESWFSVTPEKVAAHLAQRLACHTLIDGFCGSGGNAIQFAKTCQRVIAIDIDPVKIEMAKHNAEIYGVAGRIDFIVADFFHLTTRLRGDVIFLSPPWGGPKYKNKSSYDVEKFLQPIGASLLVEQARRMSENVALFLPRNSNLQQIVKIAGIGKRCEVEHNYLDTRLVAITALYGEDILKSRKIS